MVAVQGAADLDAQLAVLAEWMAHGPATPTWERACREHGEPGYGPVESDVLYAFIRAERPKRVVQVGAGVSTAVILRAAADASYQPKVICVDPFPTEYLVTLSRDDIVTLIAEPAQEVENDILLDLHAGDLLFVDSTHTVKPGSEVNRLILEVLPRLAVGTWAHFHDIMFPYDYSRGILTDDLFFWQESTLLLAFLTGNPHFAVAVSLSMLHHGRPDGLRRLVPHYQPQGNADGMRLWPSGHFPSSLFIRAQST